MPTDPPSSEGEPAPQGRRRLVVGLSVAGVLIALDQWTKSLVERLLEPGEFVSFLGPHVGWQLVYNPGAAFGIPAPHWLFLVVTVVVTVIVVRGLPKCDSWLQVVGFGMLLAGAIGNVLDRLLRPGAVDGPVFGGGHVVDFVAWGTFPRFNVADSAITVGFVLLVLALWQAERR